MEKEVGRYSISQGQKMEVGRYSISQGLILGGFRVEDLVLTWECGDLEAPGVCWRTALRHLNCPHLKINSSLDTHTRVPNYQ